MTKDEELQLIIKAQGGCIESQNLLVTANLGFIYKKAIHKKRYCPKYGFMTTDDIANILVIGLIDAIKKFDINRPTRLLTFAGFTMKTASNYYFSRSVMIRIPTGSTSDLSQEELLKLFEKTKVQVSTKEVIRHDENHTSNINDYNKEEYINRKHMAVKLYKAIEKLPPKQKYVILEKLKGRIDKEIAEQLQCSTQRVSQHYQKAKAVLHGYLRNEAVCR